MDDLTRLMACPDPAVSAAPPAGTALVSPPEETRRVARPAGAAPSASVGSTVPVVFSGPPAVSGATHQLILLQPAPGQRLPQPGAAPAPALRHYRLPAVSAAGRTALQPPAPHGDRM